MDTRRKVLGKIGLGAAATGLVVGVERRLRPAGTRPADGDGAASDPGRVAARDPAAGDGPWWLLAPLSRGDHLGEGWFLAHLGPVRRGASVLTLQHRDGEVARVHLCYHDGTPRGLAHTTVLDLVLMDGGAGDKPTDENLGRVLLGLARVIRANELADDDRLQQLAAMQPHAERVDTYGPETLT